MQVKDLENGQWFVERTLCAPQQIIGRKLRRAKEDIVVYFDVSSDTLSEPAFIWDGYEVEPINFQSVILLLTKECIDHNQPIEEIYPQNQISSKELQPGQFFKQVQGKQYARIFPNGIIVYINDSAPFWHINDIYQEAIPLTLHQIVLQLLEKELQK